MLHDSVTEWDLVQRDGPGRGHRVQTVGDPGATEGSNGHRGDGAKGRHDYPMRPSSG